MSKRGSKRKRAREGQSRKRKRGPKRPITQSSASQSVSQAIERGVAFHRAGQLELAQRSYLEVLERDPLHADANHLMGVIAHQRGNHDVAIGLFERSIKANPGFPDVHNNLGNALQAQGRFEEAVAKYRRAIELKPHYPEALGNLGRALLELDRLDEAETSLREALAQKPGIVEVQNNLGAVLGRMGRFGEARACFESSLSVEPNQARAHNNLGAALQELGLHDDACSSYQAAIALDPSYVDAHVNLGGALRNLGRLDDAISNFRKALAVDPSNAKAHRLLAGLHEDAVDAGDLSAMEALLGRDDLPDIDRMHLAFGMGKALEDAGQYRRAFERLTEANSLARSALEYSVEDDEAFFGRIRQTFCSNYFMRRMGLTEAGVTPVFIVGMIRSGTSLVEQILASHPRVYGAGECDHLENIALHQIPHGFPEGVLTLESGQFEKLGRNYLSMLTAGVKDSEYITDKMPTNFRFLGLIKAILPRAKVVHCLRDPMDTCLSVFKRYFAGRHPYAYDLRDLGRYYRAYDAIMNHWYETLPGFIHQIRYEELVADQESQTRALLDFCGLPWDDSCLSFYETERCVATASAVQVRRPIYTDSVELWKQYERQLEPLKEVLESESVRFAA